MMAQAPDALAGLNNPVLAAQVGFAVTHEMAVQLDDVILRRLIEGQTGGLTSAQIETIAAYMADQLGWTPAQTDRQVKAAVKRL
jgi:glycerol-3-phosphate dehydrogenase